MTTIPQHLHQVNAMLIDWLGISVRNILVNGATGAAFGYVTIRFAKMFAITLGVTVLMMQLMHEYGVVDIDWDVTLVEARNRFNHLFNYFNLQPLNMMPQQGFLGGFLIGMSMV